MHRTYSGLWDEQSNTREGKVRYIEAILRDKDCTGVWGTGGESWGVHTKGWQRDVVKRRMEKEHSIIMKFYQRLLNLLSLSQL